MPDVRMPDGAVVRFPDTMSPDEIRSIIARKFPEAAKSTAPQAPEPSQQTKPYTDGAFRAASEGLRSGAFFGFDDEIGAGMVAPFDAGVEWLKGNGFDVGRSYNRIQKQLDSEKAARREAHPVASTVGEISGGLATGGSAAKQGLTLAGRSLPVVGKTGAAMVEGGAYGALYGAGEAEPGNRVPGALAGAAVGALTGGALERGGQVFANRAARRVAPPAPALDDLASQTNKLYSDARAANVVLKPAAVDKLVSNAQIAAGRLNAQLRPNTAGIIDDMLARKGKPMTLEEMDELRQVVGLSMKQAQDQDVRTLMAIKKQIDALDQTLKPRDFTGDARGFQFFKDARALNTRKEKTALIEQMLDFADVDTGKYTQSGLANAIRTRAAELYRNISKGKIKGFSADEIAIVRQMAKGGSPSTMVNLIAKLAPRGVVSAGIVQMLGASAASVLGPVALIANAAIPAAGAVAARSADKGALAAASALRDAAARGYVHQLPQMPNYARPFIGGATEGTTSLVRQSR